MRPTLSPRAARARSVLATLPPAPSTVALEAVSSRNCSRASSPMGRSAPSCTATDSSRWPASMRTVRSIRAYPIPSTRAILVGSLDVARCSSPCRQGGYHAESSGALRVAVASTCQKNHTLHAANVRHIPGLPRGPFPPLGGPLAGGLVAFPTFAPMQRAGERGCARVSLHA